MERKNLNIGLFGFGCVGLGLYEVLEQTPSLNARIKRICVKSRDKQRPLPQEAFTFNASELLEDEEINTIVELIDDSDAAFAIVRQAMQKGKAVVTANKKMIAEHFEELIALQVEYGVPLLYEAACCASIPIIRNLEEYYDTDLLESVGGIVNGSTNYILTKTALENKSYPEALQEAQALGYAESNPALDVGGFDAKFKLLILIAHAFGLVVRPEQIFNLGIDNLGELELAYAREKGYKIKLIAHAERNADGRIAALVVPKFVREEEKLYSVDEVYNGIQTKSRLSDVQFFVGKGAGAYPTASAVISDISALSYGYKYEYKKLNKEDQLIPVEEIFLKVFLRHDLAYGFEFKRYFDDISESYVNQDSGYIIGTISLANLQEIRSREHAETSVVLFEVLKESLVEDGSW
ncbi:MAG: homoserine dehydrogenase [Bacteroidetes bacterium]|nr:homoserine dehydrogenase [Bacteroidota bacterium]